MKPELSIIMPCFNEEGGIQKNVEEMFHYLKDLGKSFEIILVDDGSTDKTPIILDQLARSPYIKAVHHPKNLGRGAGVRSGLAASSGDVVIPFDADLSYAPNHIPSILEAIQKQNADMVIVSAYHKQGSVKNVPWFRALVSRLGNKLLTAGSEFSVITCIVRGYTRRVIDNLEFFSDGKEFHLESFSKVQDMGFKIIEVPGRLHWRKKAKVKTKKSKKTAKRRSTFNFVKQSAAHLAYLVSEIPFMFLGIIATVFILGGLAIGGFVIAEWVRGTLAPDRPIIILMVLFLVTGLITLLFSMVANQNRYLRKEMVRTQSMIKQQKK